MVCWGHFSRCKIQVVWHEVKPYQREDNLCVASGASPSPAPNSRYISRLLSRVCSVRRGSSDRQHVPVQTQENVGGGEGEMSSGRRGSTDIAASIPQTIQPDRQPVVKSRVHQAGTTLS